MDNALENARIRRSVRRRAVFGYIYLVVPGAAFLALALYDAITEGRWILFLVLFVLIGLFFFYLPLVGHFRCPRCRHFFSRERVRLDKGATIYRCADCGHSDAVRELCGLTDMAKSSRCFVRLKPMKPIRHLDQPRPNPQRRR